MTAKMKQMAILTDVSKCIGCEECVAACKTTNNLPKDKPYRWQKSATDLSASRWTTIINTKDGHHVRKQCRHCDDPACVSVCPVGALHKTPEGPVVYNKEICMGCRYCMMSCPYGVPRYLWSEAVPYVQKCIMCYDKIKSGELKQPACTNACPTGATIYGYREDLLEEAHKRIKDNPGTYIDRVWGEKEVGGTNVLYVSPIDIGFLGWKSDLGDKPLPERTWKVLHKVPAIATGVGIAMLGTYWIIDRRMKLSGGSGQGEGHDEAVPENAPDAPAKDGGADEKKE